MTYPCIQSKTRKTCSVNELQPPIQITPGACFDGDQKRFKPTKRRRLAFDSLCFQLEPAPAYTRMYGSNMTHRTRIKTSVQSIAPSAFRKQPMSASVLFAETCKPISSSLWCHGPTSVRPQFVFVVRLLSLLCFFSRNAQD